jgi:hypothetical protein
LVILEMGFRKLFPWASLKPQSSNLSHLNRITGMSYWRWTFYFYIIYFLFFDGAF